MGRIKGKLTKDGKAAQSLQQQKAITAPGLEEQGASLLVKSEEAVADEQGGPPGPVHRVSHSVIASRATGGSRREGGDPGN